MNKVVEKIATTPKGGGMRIPGATPKQTPPVSTAAPTTSPRAKSLQAVQAVQNGAKKAAEYSKGKANGFSKWIASLSKWGMIKGTATIGIIALFFNWVLGKILGKNSEKQDQPQARQMKAAQLSSLAKY